MVQQNYLSQAVVGLADELPKCVELTQAHHPEGALGIAAAARTEVERALQKLQFAELSICLQRRSHAALARTGETTSDLDATVGRLVNPDRQK